jgi:hypothetical protein
MSGSVERSARWSSPKPLSCRETRRAAVCRGPRLDAIFDLAHEPEGFVRFALVESLGRWGASPHQRSTSVAPFRRIALSPWRPFAVSLLRPDPRQNNTRSQTGTSIFQRKGSGMKMAD